MGRPMKFETPEQMEAEVEKYFEYIKGEREIKRDMDGKIESDEWIRFPEPATVTGLALFLGFADRQSLYDYADKPEFSCIVKKAKTRVECEYEKRLAGQSPTGAIFALKNMGWKDKQETELSGGLKNENAISIADLPDELIQKIYEQAGSSGHGNQSTG